METKIQKEYVDDGFGFPVHLINVPMVKVRGVWTPNIDYNALAIAVLNMLCRKSTRLSGNELRFIRNHFSMTLKEFAIRFSVTHAAVIKWEKALNHPTSMMWSTEKDIRLFTLSKLNANPKIVGSLYQELEEVPANKSSPISIEAKLVA